MLQFELSKANTIAREMPGKRIITVIFSLKVVINRQMLFFIHRRLTYNGILQAVDSPLDAHRVLLMYLLRCWLHSIRRIHNNKVYRWSFRRNHLVKYVRLASHNKIVITSSEKQVYVPRFILVVGHLLIGVVLSAGGQVAYRVTPAPTSK